jgi:predicted ArsR family transcriptional regulator
MEVPQPSQSFVRRVATDAEARALASGLRLRMLRLCLDEPATNREIAETLHLNPATSLHHVRTLVDTGFLVALEPRRGRRGSREIPYRTTGKSWYMDTPVTGGSSLLDAFLAEIEQVSPEYRGMTRLGLRLRPDDLEEFRERLHALFAEYHDRPRDPDGEPWSLFVALHPDTSQRQPKRGPVSEPPSSTADE